MEGSGAISMFDDTIRALRKWFESKSVGRNFRRIRLTPSPSNPPEASSPFIILKEDTHVELGHPSAGSCSLCAATGDVSLIENGMMTIVGRDIQESEEKVRPFGQFIIASCKGEAGETSLEIERVVQNSSQMDGYMLRSVPNRIWGRVSKEAAAAGFSLEKLGQRLYDSILAQRQDISGIEIFFVTSNKEDIAELERIVQPAREKLDKIQTYERLPDGTYECTTGLDCTECPEKVVCDNIREVIRIRKGDRVITFERNGRSKGQAESSGNSNS